MRAALRPCGARPLQAVVGSETGTGLPVRLQILHVGEWEEIAFQKLPGMVVELPVDTRTGEIIQPVVAPLSKIKRTGLVATIHDIRKLRQISDAGKRIVVRAPIGAIGARGPPYLASPKPAIACHRLSIACSRALLSAIGRRCSWRGTSWVMQSRFEQKLAAFAEQTAQLMDEEAMGTALTDLHSATKVGHMCWWEVGDCGCEQRRPLGQVKTLEELIDEKIEKSFALQAQRTHASAYTRATHKHTNQALLEGAPALAPS
jgi:hypothetical protein